LKLVEATSASDFAAIRELFVEYAASLDFDLGFQDFDRELAELAGEYAAPGGCLVLAIENGEAAGCAGLRDLGDETAEIKRLYVRPRFRQSGLGRKLAVRIVDEACKRVDTRRFDSTRCRR